MIDTTNTQWFNQMSIKEQQNLLESFADFRSKVNQSDPNGNTLLMKKAMDNDLEYVRALLMPGLKEWLDIDLQNMKGYTALHLAVLCNHVEMVQLLLDGGADHSIRAHDNSTPAILAGFEMGNVEMMRLFDDQPYGAINDPSDVIETDLGLFESIKQAFEEWTTSDYTESSDNDPNFSDDEGEEQPPEDEEPIETEKLIVADFPPMTKKPTAGRDLQDILYNILGRTSVFTSCN